MTSLDIILNSNEDDALSHLSNLSGVDLLELQAIADKITEYVAIVLMAREIMYRENDNEKT